MKKIAVWNTAFLGDAVLTLPLIQSLRLNYPDAVIHYHVRTGLGSLFAAHPAINEVFEFHKFTLDKGISGLRAYARVLEKQKYDLFISAHSSMRTGLIARLSGAGRRIGYDSPWHSRLWYTDRVDRMFPKIHEINRLLQLAGPLNLKVFSNRPEMYFAAETVERVETLLLKKFGSARPGNLLGMHIGAHWPSKRWSPENFAEIAARALDAGGKVALFAAGKEESEISARVSGLIGQNLSGSEARAGLFDLTNMLSLPELGAFMGRLTTFLGNDSGPMHLASAAGTPVTIIFGPTVESLGFAPFGADDSILGLDLPCRPCGLHGHKSCPLAHHRCMKDLHPDLVWPHVREKLFRQ